eukprot:COSAG03_NODE_8290_length_816_cov_2.940028_3_plen_42_part_01
MRERERERERQRDRETDREPFTLDVGESSEVLVAPRGRKAAY